MKAKNSEKIIRGYLEFAGGLLISTALSMALLTGFIHTNGSEYKLMESKTQEYDKIYARQIALVDKVDSLYNYLVLMGSNDRLNQVVLQKVISTRKMELFPVPEAPCKMQISPGSTARFTLSEVPSEPRFGMLIKRFAFNPLS